MNNKRKATQDNKPLNLAKDSQQILAATYKGPLPPANQFRDYDSVFPGAAKIILDMATKEQDHRFKNNERIDLINNKAIKFNFIEKIIGILAGLLVSFAILIVGGLLIYKGHDVSGATIVSVDIVGLAAVFVYGSRKRDE